MNDENLNNNDKNLKTFDVKLDGDVDLNIEDLSFDVEGEVTSNEDATISSGNKNNSQNEEINNHNDDLSSNLANDSSSNLNDGSFGNEMIDTSDSNSDVSDNSIVDNNSDDNNTDGISSDDESLNSNSSSDIGNNIDNDQENPDSNNVEDSDNKGESLSNKDKNSDNPNEKENGDNNKNLDNTKKNETNDNNNLDDSKKNELSDNNKNSNDPKNNANGDSKEGKNNNSTNNKKDSTNGNNDANKPSNSKKEAQKSNPGNQKKQPNANDNKSARKNKVNSKNKKPRKPKKNSDKVARKMTTGGLGSKSNKLKKAGNMIKKTSKKVVSGFSKLISFLLSHPVVLGIVVALIIFLVIILAVLNVSGTITTPGQGNDIKDEYSGFSENDKKILEEINEIQGMSKANAELAIYTILFPYFESLQDGAIDSYLNGDSLELSNEEKEEYEENSNNSETRQKILDSFGCDELCQELLGSDGVNQIIKAYATESLKTKFKKFFGIDTSEDELDLDDLLENEESNNDENNNSIGEMDDPYLKLLSKSKYQKSLKILLEKLSSTAEDGDYESETEYFEYLKNTYFESDAGYKALLIQTDENNTEALKDAIIVQLKAGASLYEVYIKDNCITSNASLTPLNSAGNINESIQGDIYIRLRDYRQTGDYWVASDHFSSPILYGTDSNPLEFARYIMGVAYAEVGEGVKNEAVAKTIMVTAKSFTVGRYKSMGGEYPKPEFDEANNRTIIEMRGNVGDQDFCDVYEGCKEGTYAWSTRTEMRGSGDPKGPLSSNDIKNLEQWWNDIADVYVVNSSNGNFSGNQYDGYNDSCKKGSCVSQTDVAIAAKKESDYMNILFNADNGGFDSDSYQAFNASTGGVYAVSTGNKYCPSSNITGSRQEIVNFAISMVGKIPYYFYEGQSDGYGALGHAINKNYDDNHFNEDASMTDRNGRNKYGLDCSGFVDFVFWNVLDDNLGNGNTKILRSKSYKLSSYSDLIPGDLGFLSDEGSGTNQHVGIYIGNDEWVELNPNGVTKGEYPNFKVFYRPNILTELDQQENMDVVLTGSTVYENPIPGEKISNAYGVKGDLWSRGYHTGSDFGNNTDGKEIHSIGEGTVYCISCKGSSFGNHVVIEHADGYYSLYAHMSNKPKVIKGQKVNHSTILGNVGSTGNVTGPHLHLEFWKGVPWGSGSQDLNPANYIKL